MKYVDFQKCIPVSGYKKSILMRQVDIEKFIPGPVYKNTYFGEVR